MTRLKFLAVFFATNAYMASTSASETVYPLVTYKCNPDADIITLTNSLLSRDEGASYEYSDEKGTYSPWDLVEIDRRPEHTRIVKTKKSPEPANSAQVNTPSPSNHRYSVET